MIHAFAAAIALATASSSPSPDEIVSRAQTAWEARAVPRYLSFELPCADTFLTAECEPGDTSRFTVRMSDGRTYARTAREPGLELMCGGFITGPATTPLGFFRSIDANNVAAAIAPPPPPQNFAADPFGPRPIASVVAVNRAYTVTLVGVESLDGEAVYHLRLVPNYDPQHHPLRELWVDTATFEVIQLTYARRVEGATEDGSVQYRFAQVDPQRIWTIVRIEAEQPVKNKIETARADLENITFPDAEPDRDFVPPCSSSR
jgi:hypothetical protein